MIKILINQLFFKLGYTPIKSNRIKLRRKSYSYGISKKFVEGYVRVIPWPFNV